MKNFVLGFLVGVAIGGVAVGIYSNRSKDNSYQTKERAIASVIFGQHLYTAQATTKILRVMDDERFDTARRLITLERDSALDASYRLMESHEPDLGSSLAHQLLPGLAQTEEYLAATDGDNHLLAWLQDVNVYVKRSTIEN